MFDRIFNHVKSTLAGLVIGGAQYIATAGQSFTWKGLLVSLPTILLGLFTKDH